MPCNSQFPPSDVIGRTARRSTAWAESPPKRWRPPLTPPPPQRQCGAFDGAHPENGKNLYIFFCFYRLLEALLLSVHCRFSHTGDWRELLERSSSGWNWSTAKDNLGIGLLAWKKCLKILKVLRVQQKMTKFQNFLSFFYF